MYQINLTLTSVVFEFECYVIIYVSDKFNFNKCCIWIEMQRVAQNTEVNLTLTSVVFELYIIYSSLNNFNNLTLTSVVFE